uniref:Uncharacterized protein n=1 Tax=Setaria italica TaxID=4555 RepID=K3Z125_SETIT
MLCKCGKRPKQRELQRLLSMNQSGLSAVGKVVAP